MHTQNFGLSLCYVWFKVCAVTAKLAAYWNIAMISPVCADQQFLNKKVHLMHTSKPHAIILNFSHDFEHCSIKGSTHASL